MSYSSATISKIVDRINQSYFLPAIQRPFVWEPEQVVALFDSILKGYPISSFLFWELKPENRRNWQIYKFAEHFRFGDVHNEDADPDGRDIVLVLDGQQRLTSLLIALRGSYTLKQKNKKAFGPNAWIKKRLYIDLFKDPASENVDERDDFGITYGLKFFAEQPVSRDGHFWFKVGEVLDYSDEDLYYSYIDTLLESAPDTTTKSQLITAKRILENLYRKVWKDEIIAFFTEKNQNYDRVLDIFVRANDGGTKLSKSDLLLSMITSKWNGINAREEIYEFVNYLNSQMIRKNDFNKDFVMRACLVASDLDHSYNVTNFTNNNLFAIQNKWPDIKLAIQRTVSLINSFGIDRDTLTSVNALMPIIYYLSKVKSPMSGSSRFESENRERIRVWLLSALLNNAFGGNSDLMIGASRNAIRDALTYSQDFPSDEICDALFKRRGRLIRFDDSNLDDLLDVRYTHRTCFLAVSLLYGESNWGDSIYHIDHVIPKSLCSRKHLESIGVSNEDILEIGRNVDRLGNLQILRARENLEKNSHELFNWLSTRDSGYIRRHFIPEEPRLWRPDALLSFISAREKLIRDHFRERLVRESKSVASVAAPSISVV